MKRKILVLLSIACLIIAAAFISSCGKGTKGLEFIEISDTECGVKCGEAVDATEIVIPKKHDGKVVTTIMSTGFSKCDKLVSVTIPKTIKKIEKGAFYNCTSLENVYFKGKIKDWCNIEFELGNSSPMDQAEHFFVKGRELKNLKLKKIEAIKSYTFFGFDYLESFEADKNLTAIGENAFAGCVGLSSVKLPSSLAKLEKLCFSNCKKLKEIVIPASTSQIHRLAFYEAGLNTVTFEDTEKWFTTTNPDATRGDKYDVTDPELNAYYFIRTASGYLKRVLPTT